MYCSRSLLLCLLFSSTILVKAGIIDAPFDWLGDALDDILGPSMDHASQAVRQVLDDLFSQRVVPLVDKINSLIVTDIDTVNADLQKLADKLQDYVRRDIQTFFDDATKFADEEIDQIKAKIIDEAFAKMDALESQTFVDLNKLLDKIALIVDKLDCSLISTANAIVDEIKSAMYELFPNPLEYCRGVLASEWPWFKWTSVAEMSLLQLYKLHACRSLQYVTENSPLVRVCDAWLDVESYASNARCVAASTTPPGASSDLETYFLNELAKASSIYSTFDCGSHHLSDTPSACNTPVECYAEAVRMLKDATKDVQDVRSIANDAMHLVNRTAATVYEKLDSLTNVTRACMSQTMVLLRRDCAVIVGACTATFPYRKGDGFNVCMSDGGPGRGCQAYQIGNYCCNWM